jgi:hypothetical protein
LSISAMGTFHAKNLGAGGALLVLIQLENQYLITLNRNFKIILDLLIMMLRLGKIRVVIQFLQKK